MLHKVFDFCRSVNARVLTGAVALSAFAVPALVRVEGGESVQLDSSITGIDIAGGLSSVGSMVASGIALGIGLAASIWAIQLVWRKIRSVAR